jgi:hypothetical protein
LKVVAFGEVPESVYFLGNSLTVDAMQMLPRAAAAAGLTHVNQYQVANNMTLAEYWRNQGEVSSTYASPAKFPTAFQAQSWDVIVLQPHMGMYESADDEIAAALALIDFARSNPSNADTRFMIYAAISGRPNIPVGSAPSWFPAGKTYAQMWDADYTGGYAGNLRSREFFEEVFFRVRDARPDVDIGMIPVGHAFRELERRVADGTLQLSEITDTEDLYRDLVHMNDLGRYLAATTFLATLYDVYPDDVDLGLSGTGLTADSRLALQEIAVAVVPEPRAAVLAMLAMVIVAAARKYGSSRSPVSISHDV